MPIPDDQIREHDVERIQEVEQSIPNMTNLIKDIRATELFSRMELRQIENAMETIRSARRVVWDEERRVSKAYHENDN